MADFGVSLSSASRQSRERSLTQRGLAVTERIVQQLRLWQERIRQRAALAALDERLLDDVGISRERARQETEKPFWL